MRKYDKRTCRFLRLIGVIVTLVLKRHLFALIFAVLLSLFFRSYKMSGLISFSNSTSKNSVGQKDLGYAAYFVSNFVAMATGVGRGGICLTAFNSCPRKPPAVCKNLGDIFRKNRVIDYLF